MSDRQMRAFGEDAARAREILEVLARYGIAERAARKLGVEGQGVGRRGRFADPELVRLDTGARLTSALSELGTTWIKLGQSLSMRADIIGDEVAQALTGLQADVPADPVGLAQDRIAAELGAPVEELYADFESVPFASGSVAQVHRAVLKDGTDAVVKVLHHGAEAKVRNDLNLMAALAAFLESADPDIARYSPSVMVAEFTTMMLQAVDLRHELTSMRRFAAELSGFDWLIVPEPFPELSSSGVLTMERMEGSSVRTASDVTGVGWAVNDLTRHVTEAWLHMIFDDGLYHADPHPGNFLVPDSDHLILLDYGDIGYLSGPRRHDVVRLLMAIIERDVASLTDILLVVCRAPAATDAKALERAVDHWMSEYLPENSTSGDRDMGAAATAVMQLLRRFDLSLPSDLAILIRVMIRLEGFGAQLGSTVTVEEYLAPFLTEYIRDEKSLRNALRKVTRSASSWRQITRDLPRDLGILVQQLRDGDTRMEINFRDPDELTDKIVDGVIASSSLLAASQLMSHRIGPTVKGFSVPGIAAAGVAAATWRSLAVRRRSHKTLAEDVFGLIRRRR